MSFSDRPALSTGKKIGCFAYAAFGTLVIFICVGLASLGDCERKADGTCVNAGGLTDYLPLGSVIVVIGFGVLLAWYQMRDQD